jgi:HEAT repeat protein
MPTVSPGARLLLVSAFAACTGGAPLDVPPAPPGVPVFPPAPPPGPTNPPAPVPAPPLDPAPTFRDPELGRRVQVLAGFLRIESSHIGAAGAPSAAFAAFDAVRQLATEEDLVALLRHPSPVVRGYVAQHVARAVPRALPAALALLGDTTPVGQVQGCMISEGTVGGVVSEALCWSTLPEAKAEVARRAREGSPGSVWAIACVGSSDPVQAAQLALARLAGRSVPASEHASLLRLIGNGALGEPGCVVLVPAAAAADADVRVAAAQGLSGCAGPAGLDALRRLALDPDATVNRIAHTELVLHPDLPAAEREALLGDGGVANRVSVQLSFRMGRPGVLARLGERYGAIATAHPELSWSGLASLPASEPAITLARAIARAVPVGTNARRDAMGHVSRHGDARDLPEIRRSLESPNVSEVIDALEALARLHDGASRSAVASLVRHSNASVSRTATATLGRL